MIGIEHVMKTNVVTVEKGTPITEAVRKLVDHDFTGVPVVDDKNRVVGILSEKDVLALALRRLENGDSGDRGLRVDDFMTRDVVCIDITDSFASLCSCLMKHEFRRVPIIAKGKLVGIVSRRDIILHILNAAG
ncbi:MAG: CBS domain-containing protein [Phycisphaerae bacterium]|nr:CBS domain-containing protein [Phycisphaerae bacterium]